MRNKLIERIRQRQLDTGIFDGSVLEEKSNNDLMDMLEELAIDWALMQGEDYED